MSGGFSIRELRERAKADAYQGADEPMLALLDAVEAAHRENAVQGFCHICEEDVAEAHRPNCPLARFRFDTEEEEWAGVYPGIVLQPGRLPRPHKLPARQVVQRMSVEARLTVGLIASLLTLGLVALWWIDPDGWWRQ